MGTVIKLSVAAITAAVLLTAADAAFGSPKTIYRDWFLATDGAELDWRTHPWVWLEKVRTGELGLDDTVHVNVWYDDESSEVEYEARWVWEEADVTAEKAISDFVMVYTRNWNISYEPHPYPPYDAWDFGAMQGNIKVSWMLYRYGEVLPEASYSLVLAAIQGMKCVGWGTGTLNSQIAQWVSRYLATEQLGSCSSEYSNGGIPHPHIYEFTWEDQTYTPEEEYDARELSRALLQYNMSSLAHWGYEELDSPDYTRYIIHALVTLSEFAEDEEMKRWGKMAADFLFLESALDHSAEQWGGATGRSYSGTYREGKTCFPWRMYFDDTHRHATCAGGDFANAVLGGYDLPNVIQDVGDYRDEPDDYWHMNLESFHGNKWTYVTKHFNLGGSKPRAGVPGDMWNLNIKTDGDYPFNIWINTREPGDDEWTDEGNVYRGEYGYQYRNAMLVAPVYYDVVFDIYEHYGYRGNDWDGAGAGDGWQFFMEGKTMAAINFQACAAIEVAVEGADYASFEEFQSAVMANASLTGCRFVTSKGDTLISHHPGDPLDEPIPEHGCESEEFCWRYEAVMPAGEEEFQWVFPHRFLRIDTKDNEGNSIVDWDAGVMTVQRHGRSCVYDFNAWTYSGDCEYIEEPPPDEDGPEPVDAPPDDAPDPVEPAPDAAPDAAPDPAPDATTDGVDVAADGVTDAADAPTDTADEGDDSDSGCGCTIII